MISRILQAGTTTFFGGSDGPWTQYTWMDSPGIDNVRLLSYLLCCELPESGDNFISVVLSLVSYTVFTLLPTKPSSHGTQSIEFVLSEIFWASYETLKTDVGHVKSKLQVEWYWGWGFRNNPRRFTKKVSLELILETDSRSPSWEQVSLGAWYQHLGPCLGTKEQSICSPNLHDQSGSHHCPFAHA